MSRFLEASVRLEGGFVDLSSQSAVVQEAIRKLGDHSLDQTEACVCVSGWCEGNLCPLPNPAKERITDGGVIFTHLEGFWGAKNLATRKVVQFVVLGAVKNSGQFSLLTLVCLFVNLLPVCDRGDG